MIYIDIIWRDTSSISTVIYYNYCNIVLSVLTNMAQQNGYVSQPVMSVRNVTRNQRGWKAGLFDCFSVPGLCIKTCFLPCVTYVGLTGIVCFSNFCFFSNAIHGIIGRNERENEWLGFWCRLLLLLLCFVHRLCLLSFYYDTWRNSCKKTNRGMASFIFICLLNQYKSVCKYSFAGQYCRGCLHSFLVWMLCFDSGTPWIR